MPSKYFCVCPSVCPTVHLCVCSGLSSVPPKFMSTRKLRMWSFWKVFADGLMTLGHCLGSVLGSMTNVPVRVGEGSQRCAERRTLCEDGGSNAEDCWHPPEARTEARDRFSLRVPRSNWFCQHRDFILLASGIVRKHYYFKPPGL